MTITASDPIAERYRSQCTHPRTEWVGEPRPASNAIYRRHGWKERTWRCRRCGHTSTMQYHDGLPAPRRRDELTDKTIDQECRSWDST